MIYDERIIADPSAENTSTLEFYRHAVGYLLHVLKRDPYLSSSLLATAGERALNFWSLSPQDRQQSKVADAAMDLHVLGTIGKAVFRCGGIDNPQLRKELIRLVETEYGLLANYYLFYVAGTLGAAGYGVQFVSEEPKKGARTPDLLASKADRRAFVEATVKEPVRAIHSTEQLGHVIRDVFEEKRRKFMDVRFTPGLIAFDATPIANRAGQSDLAPGVRLQERLLESDAAGQLYPVP